MNYGKKGKFSKRVKKSPGLKQDRLSNPYRNEPAEIFKAGGASRTLFNEYDKNDNKKRESGLDGFGMFI